MSTCPWTAGIWYPFHFAAEHDDVALIQLLYEYDARINARTAAVKTPLLVAVESGSTAAALCLIEMGAEVSLADDEGRTPLHFAAIENNFPVLQHLLVKGADPNTEDNKGITPLIEAVSSKKRDDDEVNMLKTLRLTRCGKAKGSEKWAQNLIKSHVDSQLNPRLIGEIEIPHSRASTSSAREMQRRSRPSPQATSPRNLHKTEAATRRNQPETIFRVAPPNLT